MMHADLLNSERYNEYRQYILLIFYSTKANGDLNNMSDMKEIIDNFIDYGHRGLQILKNDYLESADGDMELQNKFAEYLSRCRK